MHTLRIGHQPSGLYKDMEFVGGVWHYEDSIREAGKLVVQIANELKEPIQDIQDQLYIVGVDEANEFTCEPVGTILSIMQSANDQYGYPPIGELVDPRPDKYSHVSNEELDTIANTYLGLEVVHSTDPRIWRMRLILAIREHDKDSTTDTILDQYPTPE